MRRTNMQPCSAGLIRYPRFHVHFTPLNTYLNDEFRSAITDDRVMPLTVMLVDELVFRP